MVYLEEKLFRERAIDSDFESPSKVRAYFISQFK